jgi:methylglutaconyl-CoA hydratase
MSFLKIIDEGEIVQVILSRPEVRNAFNPEMIQEVTHTFRSLKENKNARAVVLRGEGKVFCAGADLSWMQSMANYSFEQNQEDAFRLYEMFESIERLDVPVLGSVQGAVFAGGLGLVSACDMVISERATQFCFSETKLGLIPATISAFVKNKVFLGWIKPYMLSAQIFSAEKAFDMGLVHELVENQEEAEKVLSSWIRNFYECGPEALRATKSLLREIPYLSSSFLKETTTKAIAERRVSTEGQEGLKSFLQKRTPSWRIKE